MTRSPDWRRDLSLYTREDSSSINMRIMMMTLMLIMIMMMMMMMMMMTMMITMLEHTPLGEA